MGSPMEMNGGSVIAMTGKDCVAIASDLRLGQQAVGLTADFEKVSLRGGLEDNIDICLGHW
jgi:20S proteasome subunit beta 3